MIKRLLKLLPSRTIEVDGKPYLTRYYLTGKNRTLGTGVWLHHFHSSDPGKELHDHPWTGLSLILAGGYLEERCRLIQTVLVPVTGSDHQYEPLPVYSAVERRACVPGTFNRLGLRDFHRATLLDEKRGSWSLFFAGKRQKDWGFLDTETRRFTPRTEVGAIP